MILSHALGKAPSRLRAFIPLAALLVIASCGDDGVSSHTHEVPGRGHVGPHAFVSGAQVFDASIPIPPNSTGQGLVNWMNVGTIPEPSTANGKVRVRVSGSIRITANQDYLDNICNNSRIAPYEKPECPGLGGLPGKVVGPGGWDAQTLRVRAQVVAADGSISVVSLARLASDTTVYEGWATKGGQLQVFRYGSAYEERSWLDPITNVRYGPYPALLFSAEGAPQHVEVNRFGPLTVTVTTPRIAPGGTAIFASDANGGTATDQVWTFVPDDTVSTPRGVNSSTTVTVSSCNGQSACSFVPPASGRMYLAATMEGQRFIADPSGIVWLRDCRMFKVPPPDTLLTSPLMLNVIEDLAKRSKWNSGYNSRLEQGGYLLAGGGLTPGYTEFTYGAGFPTACRSDHFDERGAYLGQGYTLVVPIHTHADAGHGSYPNNGGCPTSKSETVRTYDGPSGGRGNEREGDLVPWKRDPAGHAYRAYELDPEHIHSWENVQNPDGSYSLVQHSYEFEKGAHACLSWHASGF